MTLDYDPISSLEAVGYMKQEAAFLYLVAIHSGYFLRRQYCRFMKQSCGALATRFLAKADRLHHIQVIQCKRDRHIYHLTSKTVYEALGHADSQNRRIKGDVHIKSRLMILDFLIDRLGTFLLEDDAAKIDFFTTQCGVARETLPHRRTTPPMFFVDGFPILLTTAGVPQFTFFDGGQATATRFQRFLRQYQPLFKALGQFEMIYVSDRDRNADRAKASFERFLPEDRLRGVTPMTPKGVDHFLDYLAISRRKNQSMSLDDMRTLHEGEAIYTRLEHRALLAAWMAGSTTADKIRQRFQQNTLQVSFSAVVLPYSYPIDNKHSEPSDDECEQTRQHTHPEGA